MKEIKPETLSYIGISQLFELFGFRLGEREQILEGRLGSKFTWGDIDLALVDFHSLLHVMNKDNLPSIEKKFHVELLAYSLDHDVKDLFVDLSK